MKLGFENYVNDSDRVSETINKIKETCLERYGHKNFGAGVAAKEKKKKTFSETIALWDYEERLERTSKAREAVNHRGGFSSKPEKRVRHCLVELGIDFKSNVHLWHYNYDIVFDNIIIEVQGDMWHANPSKYKEDDLIMGKILAKTLWEKDLKKKKKAEENGFQLIEIWEHAIVARNDEDLLNLVKGLLYDNP
jgi:G:T-mismatch repair DNA endonuclease (very short patch repair protein)